MAKTRHIGQRMSQRGIKQALVDITLRYGEHDQDRCVLGRQALELLLGLMRNLIQLIDKGGLVVVEKDGHEITTYRADSYRRQRGHAR